MLADEAAPTAKAATAHPWWRGAAIYQIYPRSFADSNGDGIGDLPGITSRLDYVARLGVDAIWLSPFFKSPMRDFGYDISDYCAVDPIFGTLHDFDQLVRTAHAAGLKVIIDQVYSHTSDQHAWFQQSRQSRDNEHADWYVWADAKQDGSPPNNWQSVFGGPAWTWDARRGQYYLHNFLSEQPDLNVHNLAVQDALVDVTRFWLDRGVDGFRLDAINFAMHDPSLQDNPPAPPGGKRTRPFDFQQHVYNQSHPEIANFLKRVRDVTDEYGARFTVAEVGGDDALAEMQTFTRPGHLNSAYGFDFLYADRLTPRLVASVAQHWPEEAGWPTWAFENHDAPRAISRWVDEEHRTTFARSKMLLLCSLRGSITIWQGEELGLPQVDVPFDKLQDPEAIANWPLTLSRDGARTPMPWEAQAPNLGFTNGVPWLPLGSTHVELAIDRQETAESTLNFTRKCLALRHARAALHHGSMTILEAGDQLLVFERTSGGETLRCTFNLSDRPASYRPSGTPLIAAGDIDGSSLGPYAAVVEEIA
ncbi:alpha-glucosidase family protein [Sphingomonas sp. SM33]|uniref:Alpha-glucosidase family protein n=1 Tax=Sphingomonas telluris TaxID=2907998 RepID=A0ABS9VRC0_9SPHN|nr:alpha-glucosidase [Sphingomonas telluris]MCH8617124.1 alpha-glucosidase family protein [Sphingomonas telluris]